MAGRQACNVLWETTDPQCVSSAGRKAMLSVRQKKQHIRYTKYVINNTYGEIARYYHSILAHPPFPNVYPVLNKLTGLTENTLLEVFGKISQKTMTEVKSPYTTLMWVPDKNNESSRVKHDFPWDYTAYCDMGPREPSFYPETGYASQQQKMTRERQVRRLEDAAMPRFKETPILGDRKKPTPAQVEALLHKPRNVRRNKYSPEDQQLVVTEYHTYITKL